MVWPCTLRRYNKHSPKPRLRLLAASRFSQPAMTRVEQVPIIGVWHLRDTLPEAAAFAINALINQPTFNNSLFRKALSTFVFEQIRPGLRSHSSVARRTNELSRLEQIIDKMQSGWFHPPFGFVLC